MLSNNRCIMNDNINVMNENAIEEKKESYVIIDIDFEIDEEINDSKLEFIKEKVSDFINTVKKEMKGLYSCFKHIFNENNGDMMAFPMMIDLVFDDPLAYY